MTIPVKRKSSELEEHCSCKVHKETKLSKIQKTRSYDKKHLSFIRWKEKLSKAAWAVTLQSMSMSIISEYWGSFLWASSQKPATLIFLCSLWNACDQREANRQGRLLKYLEQLFLLCKQSLLITVTLSDQSEMSGHLNSILNNFPN